MLDSSLPPARRFRATFGVFVLASLFLVASASSAKRDRLLRLAQKGPAVYSPPPAIPETPSGVEPPTFTWGDHLDGDKSTARAGESATGSTTEDGTPHTRSSTNSGTAVEPNTTRKLIHGVYSPRGRVGANEYARSARKGRSGPTAALSVLAGAGSAAMRRYTSRPSMRPTPKAGVTPLRQGRASPAHPAKPAADAYGRRKSVNWRNRNLSPFLANVDQALPEYSLPDQRRLFRFRKSFGSFRNRPRDRDVLGGTLPVWLEEAVQEGKVMEAVAKVRAMANVLVMGQGTSVLAREYGAAVNRYKEVIRFNRFEIKGFAKFVGSKTDTWVLNNIDIGGSPPPGMELLDKIKTIQVYVPSQRSKDKVQIALEDVEHDNIRVSMIDYPNLQRWRGVFNFTGKYFSTGMITLLRILKIVTPVGIHGFDFGKGSHGHYFAQLTEDTCHDVEGEGFIFQQLQFDGAVVPLACLEAGSRKEAMRECRVMRITPPANRYQKNCTKNERGERLDLSPEEKLKGEAAVLGMAGLPKPIVRRDDRAACPPTNLQPHEKYNHNIAHPTSQAVGGVGCVSIPASSQSQAHAREQGDGELMPKLQSAGHELL